MKDMATAGMTHTKREPLLIRVAFPAQQRAEKRGSTGAAWEGWLNPCSPKHTDPLSCSLFPVYIRFKPKGKLTAACSAGWEWVLTQSCLHKQRPWLFFFFYLLMSIRHLSIVLQHARNLREALPAGAQRGGMCPLGGGGGKSLTHKKENISH